MPEDAVAAMADDDDPFAVFGEEEEDEKDIATESMSSWAGQKLVEQANQRMAENKEKPLAEQDGGAAKSSEPTTSAELLALDKLDLWPNTPPLYLGPIQLVSSLSVGGGRGFVATHDLSPGTLVLVEEPVMTWSDAQIGKALDLISVKHILQHAHAQSIIHDMEDFHPTKDAVDEGTGDALQIHDMMQTLKAQYEDDGRLDEYVQLANEQNLCCRNGSELSSRDILRLLLVLRYNGLESGVYRHVAMLNHDCRPNCVKFMPTSGYSEVRTTRRVEMGESLTISYLPRIVGHATRRRLLWDQHRFDVGVESLGDWRFMEFIGNSLPPSSLKELNESSVTFCIESATSQLEDHCREAEAVVALDGSEANPVWNEVKALEVASLELYTETNNRLRNENHLLLIPCLRLHLDTCDLVQRDPNLTRSQRILLLCRLVSSATSLLKLQERLFGPHHFDLARTHLEFAQAMEELLSTAPEQVVQLGIPNMSTFEACSAAEHQSRKEHERIKLLYPHDVQTMIQAKRKETT